MAQQDKTQKILELMKKPDNIRNIGIVAHIDHGKTTLSDNLLFGAGMLSEELAGKQLYMDTMEEEQERGITIQTANVSMVHKFDGKEYLINLLDTPGHVDFGGDVTRAMRAVDGAVVLVDAVEGAMPQTENVLRQALKERVKPLLFINKVDRLVRELNLTPEKMQERFVSVINEINSLIRGMAPKEFKDKWAVSVQEGSVSFGSAYHNWALNVDIMKEKNVSFKDILEAYREDTWKDLIKRIPLHEAVLSMVVKHLPSPVDSSPYRIPQIWTGDVTSKVGKNLTASDPNAPLVFGVTKIVVDPQAGEISYGRVFAGTLNKGEEVYLNMNKSRQRMQQVVLSKGAQRLTVDNIPAGNIAGIVGLKGARSGETVSIEPMDTFEEIAHLFEPVVSKAIEAKNPKDLPKLIEVLKQLEKEDPTIRVELNEETGENIISGLGELHLEIKEHTITRDKGLDVVVSPPLVVYRETVEKPAGPSIGKSPNKHNHLFVSVEPMPEKLHEAIHSGELPEADMKKRKDDLVGTLVEHGMSRDDARNVRSIYKGNMLLDSTRGIVYINEIIELVIQSFKEVMKSCPLAREPGDKIIVRLTDAKLHEDSIHRGPAQIIPAFRRAAFNSILKADDLIYEPIQTIRIDAPTDYLGAVSKLVQGRRGQLIDTKQEEGNLTIVAKLPVAESFGFTSSLRANTNGRGSWFLMDQHFHRLPFELQNSTVRKIRERRGLSKEPPKPEEE